MRRGSDVGRIPMPAQKSKWAQIFMVLEATRRQARELEERENRQFGFGMLLFLLFISLVSLAIFLVRRIY
jgi:hypothetical protein